MVCDEKLLSYLLFVSSRPNKVSGEIFSKSNQSKTKNKKTINQKQSILIFTKIKTLARANAFETSIIKKAMQV